MKLEVKPIPVPFGFNHPDTPGNILPRHEFRYIMNNQYGYYW